MKVFRKIAEWQKFRSSVEMTEKSLGFVPTMGALHEGHASLVERSKKENHFTLVSIFVNPTQFDDPEDFRKYPLTLEADLKKLEFLGADFVLVPDAAEIYADQYRYHVSETKLSQTLCGPSRPVHFQGVLTVVLKLLNLARAQKAYFGEKDFQQYLLVKGMAEAFFMETAIIPCPTIREGDGLAMSSRNRRLSQAERERAALFPKLLLSNEEDGPVAQALEDHGFAVDYIKTVEGRRFGAVKLGSVRLIDNVGR